ncbi:MAG: tetratricopeptide repeat protein [Desulfarculaceae bacterium]|nr:tetratricopeptide repeat protein [Desulfarculaceae bacterium]MCF8072690.1 tetratricopeptide repeat protein [Desulfarculaceae bacterium]MCF8102569.1 tetratricopeptide repeat protein [Desulfarculaceae bacterium]MCF8116478.1 tetratricopeptide repeat protein [Desulfarculaceae bacterium]
MRLKNIVLAVCLLAALPVWAGAAEGAAKCAPQSCLDADRAGREGQYEQSLKLYAKCLRSRKLTPSQRATVYNNRGNAHYFAKNYSKALADYNQALKKDPDNALAYYNKGYVYATLERPAVAIEMFDQALKRDPRFARAYHDRGMARLLWKRAWSPQVERDLVLAVCLDPRYVGKLYRMGMALDKAGFPVKLVHNFAERVLKTSGMASRYAIEGTKARRQKNYQQAIVLYDKSLAINPYDPTVLANRGVTRFLLKENDKALADYNQALAYDPRYAEARLFRGMVHQRQGDYAKALADMNASLTLRPKLTPAWYRRGLLYEKMGKRDQAVADMRHFLELEPQSKAGAAQLKRLLAQ